MSDYTCPICGATYKEADRGKQWAEKNPCKSLLGGDIDFVAF